MVRTYYNVYVGSDVVYHQRCFEDHHREAMTVVFTF